MKKFLITLIIAFLALLHLEAYESDALSDFYPAEENSSNEKAIMESIRERIETAGLNYHEETLDSLKDCHSFSKNIYGDFNGTTENSIVLAFPIIGADNSPVNIMTALDAMEKICTRQHSLNIRFAFLGAEYGEGNDYPIGSKVFTQNLYSEKCILIYFDLSSISDTLIFQTGNNRNITPCRLLRICTDAMDLSGLKYNLRSEQNMLYNIGMIPPSSPLDTYMNAGIPSLIITSRPSDSTITPQEWGERFTNFISSLTEQADQYDFSESPDLNYLTLRWNGNYFILSGLYILLFFLAVSALIIFYIVFHARQAKFYIKKIYESFYIIPCTIIIILIILSISTGLTKLFLNLIGLDKCWQGIAGSVFIFKILVALTLLIFFSPAFRHYKKFKLGNFYTGSAILTAIIDLFIFTIIDFSLSLHFIWGLFWIFIFTIFKRRRVKFLCFLLAGTFMFLTIHGIFFYPALNLCENLIFSSSMVNLLISVLTLPFLFMGIRIFFVLPPKLKLKHKVSKFTAFISVLILLCLTASYIYTYRPYDANHKQTVRIDEFYDLDEDRGTLTASSSYRLGSIGIVSGNDNMAINTNDKNAVFPISKPPVFTDITANTYYFLERKNITININARGKADKIQIMMSPAKKGDRLLILDASYPYEVKHGTFVFSVGKNQGMPFSFEITTPKDNNFSIQLLLNYSQPPVNFEFSADETQICQPSLTLKKTLTFQDS